MTASTMNEEWWRGYRAAFEVIRRDGLRAAAMQHGADESDYNQGWLDALCEAEGNS